MILALSIAGVLLALIPAGLFFKNLPLFLFPNDEDLNADRSVVGEEDSDSAHDSLPSVSVLIPARDEESSIERSVRAALDSRGVTVEVVVLDDHSADRTAEIVQSLADQDSRVVYRVSETLPEGWNGKQFACRQLADIATFESLLFLDADVRLHPDSLMRLCHRQDADDLALLSVFPHQETGTFLEKWIIPMMHYILLGFLPLDRMRDSPHPAYAAGCGQLFLTTKTAYQSAGTHEAIQGSRHDGLKLPRVYRAVGLMTDVYDGTDLADCRMYRSAGEVVRGVLKNASEGIANPKLIVPFTILLIGGSVLPILTLVASCYQMQMSSALVSLLGVGIGHAPRAAAAKVLKQPVQGVIFHAPATFVFVILQWIALANQLLGRQVAWRGRTSS
ncbi:MAG: glycosyltransferase [Rubripirellula sp.]